MGGNEVGVVKLCLVMGGIDTAGGGGGQEVGETLVFMGTAGFSIGAVDRKYVGKLVGLAFDDLRITEPPDQRGDDQGEGAEGDNDGFFHREDGEESSTAMTEETSAAATMYPLFHKKDSSEVAK